jgi:hypothetical protein
MTENNAGVMFSDEAPICAAPAQTVASGMYKADVDMQDIKSYLGRPALISLGSLSATTSSLFNTPASWTTLSSLIPFFEDRLRGVQGLRATLVFTVEHAANPFHQGLLVSCFQYGAGAAYARHSTPWACTNLPHVRLDLSSNTMSVLRVPYLAEYEYWGRATNESTRESGEFNLFQVLPTPLLANSSTPTFKVFLHLEDIELIGRRPVADVVTVTPQAGSLQSRESASVGAASGILEASSTFAKAVGNHMPSLRAFASTASWFLSASSKAAAAFGFSKPVDLGPVLRTIRFPSFFEQSVDSVAPAIVVGGFQSNQVSVHSKSGGSEVDEMSFDTILTRYCQIFRGTFTTAFSHGATIYASAVCPYHMWFRVQGLTSPGGNIALPAFSALGNAYQPSSIMYFSQFFRYFHGSFRYRVTFAKSKFHTGRILFTFVPGSVAQPNVSSFANAGSAPTPFAGRLQPSQLSKIFDLKDGNCFEFDVDYIFPTPYATVTSSLGAVSMQIMDPLVNNGESFGTISYLVEVCAKPGFHFAGLKSPAAPAFSQFGSPVVLQAGTGVVAEDVADLTVGEKFMSAKQLAMAATVRRFDNANATITTTALPYWTSNCTWPTASAAIDTATRDSPLTRSAMVAACYGYCVGSTLLTVHSPLSAASAIKVYVEDADFNFAVSGPSSIYRSDSPAHSVSVLSQLGLSGGTYLLPTLSPTLRFDPAGLTNIYSYGGSLPALFDTPISTTYKLAVRNNDGAARNIYVGVAAADDARGLAYLGPPLCLLRTSAAGATSWTTGNAF